ncbi:MAG: amino acid ABC transporter permease [Alphaproteobacteria bacterium]
MTSRIGTGGFLWTSRRARSWLYQILAIAGVVALGWYLVDNTLDNLARRGINSGFEFLGREAGFEIGERFIAYAPYNSYSRALVVGLLNTLVVSGLGIALATILGTIVGIARLSTNWLVARLASAYVEALRNVPLILQLFLWYALITESLPGPRQALSLMPGVFLSNRGFKLPALIWESAHTATAIALVMAIAATMVLKRWADRRRDLTGHAFPMVRAGAALIIGLPMLVFLALGAPSSLDMPELRGFNFQGGFNLSPELAALLFGLTVYTATFIAEIVRSGILAVPEGQKEAALALGFSRGLALRLVILPQAMRVIVPPLTSQYLNLTKNSSLAIAIGYPDLVNIANTTMNQTGQAIEGVALVMAVYLAVSLGIAAFMNWYNHKMRLVVR